MEANLPCVYTVSMFVGFGASDFDCLASSLLLCNEGLVMHD